MIDAPRCMNLKIIMLKYKKPDQKRVYVTLLHFYINLEKQKLIHNDRKQISSCLEGGGIRRERREGLHAKGHKESVHVGGYVHYRSGADVSQVYTYVKTSNLTL